MARPPISNEQRFWKYVVQAQNGCWIWTGARNSKGYGQFRVRISTNNQPTIPAHRFAYELLVGPIPDGLVLDHIVCDNPPCVNPAHTKPVTNGQNVLRGQGISAENARKTECKRGHPLSGTNLRILASGSRSCRTCQRNGDRRRSGADLSTTPQHSPHS